MKLKYSATAHGYWLDGKRCKSPSAIAKVADDSSALDKWRRRQTAIGLALRPELLTEVATAVGDNRALDAICERAMEHAGAGSGRDWGSAVHLATEMIDAGVPILETPEIARVKAQWLQLLADNDLTVIASEAVIVHPEELIAGRFDRIVQHKSGRRFILDIKTGTSAATFLHGHAVQLWLYASAPLMASGPQGDNDFEVDEFEPMIEVSRKVALVAHLPADGDPSIVPVDIAAGRDCLESVIRPIWAWRARKDLRCEMPTTPSFTGATVAVTVAPDEGPTVDLDALRARYKAADEAHLRWIAGIRAEAVAAGVDIHLADHPTMRRARIMDGLLTLVEAECHDDDAVRALVREATGDDAVEWPTVAVGVAVGSMGAAEADAFAAACQMFVLGRFGLLVEADGPRLVAA